MAAKKPTKQTKPVNKPHECYRCRGGNIKLESVAFPTLGPNPVMRSVWVCQCCNTVQNRD